MAGWFAEVGTSWSAKQMLAHYTTYYASDNPAVRDAMATIARNAFDNVATFVNQQNMQDALGQVAYQYRLREAERQQQLYEINLQYQADMAAIQAENDALLFYHTVNQTATVLKDPSFATHTVLDVVGLIPVVGEPADLLNSVIYLAEGNYLDASLSAAGAIPFAGWAASGAQIVKNTYRAANAAMEVADTVGDGIRLADNLPLSAATPPASTITTFDPVPPMVKMPEAPIALPKTPDIPVTRSGTAESPSTPNPQYRSDDPRHYAASVTPGGHPAGDAVIAGHGEYRFGSGDAVVPEGTRVYTYAEDGTALTDQIGRAVEGGDAPAPVRIYEAGETLPNYTVKPPDNLNVLDESIMVPRSTLLEDLLEPGMGNCHLAICLVNETL